MHPSKLTKVHADEEVRFPKAELFRRVFLSLPGFHVTEGLLRCLSVMVTILFHLVIQQLNAQLSSAKAR